MKQASKNFSQKFKLISIALLMIIGTQSCYFSYNDSFCMFGSGDIVSEEVILEDFNSIVNQTVVDIEIEQGDGQKVIIEGHQNMLDELLLSVSGEELQVDLSNSCYKNFKLKVYITIPELEEVKSESTGDIEIADFTDLSSLYLKTGSTGDIIGTGVLEVDNTLEIEGTSTGNVKLEVYTQDILVNLSGTGDIVLFGSCYYQNIDMNGTADFKAYDLESEICDIRSAGTGDAKLNVSEELNVAIRSTGDVYYIGSPSIDLSITSVGDLVNAN